MDISPSTFQRLVPSILDAIAKAHFITLDLELSGIPSQQSNKRKAVEGSNGKPALQERYAETRIAAEKYQVLQLGITCVEQDGTRGTPFRISTSQKRRLIRCRTICNAAVQFLSQPDP